VLLPQSDVLEESYRATSIQVIGDDVWWIGADGITDDPYALPPIYDETFYVRRTPWAAAEPEPEVLYTSERELESFVVVGDQLFVAEEVGEEDSYTYEQRIVDLATGEVGPMTAQALYGGAEASGDDEWLYVTRQDLETPDGYGFFRVRRDGSGAERLLDAYFAPDMARRDGVWAWVEISGLDIPYLIHRYTIADGVRQVGCMADTNATMHAVTLDDANIYVSLFRDSQATILAYPL
jgi:hypothetical protein